MDLHVTASLSQNVNTSKKWRRSLQVDPERARKPITRLPEGTEYYTEGNTKYAYHNDIVYLWSSLTQEWGIYSRYEGPRHWKKITKK